MKTDAIHSKDDIILNNFRTELIDRIDGDTRNLRTYIEMVDYCKEKGIVDHAYDYLIEIGVQAFMYSWIDNKIKGRVLDKFNKIMEKLDEKKEAFR